MDKYRRNLLLGAVATAAVGTFGFGATKLRLSKKSIPVANAQLGINLAGIADWSTEFPFVDLFKQSRAWFVEGKQPADSGLTLDADGWITQLPLGTVASTIVSVLGNSHFPSGDYVILYDGEGVIKVPNQLYKSVKPGRIVVNVYGEKGIFRLDISKVNPQNYIKNIRVVPIAQEETYLKHRWNPTFLARWSGVACLRFMDFMATNNAQLVTWKDRAKPSNASFASMGVPLEWLVDLANELNCDAWFCMPHKADDDYIKQFALYVKDNLKPNLRAWVENSNEVWNGAFQQNKDAAIAGQRLDFSQDSGKAALRYYAYRSVQIFKIWTDVYKRHDRFVRVLAAQAAYSPVAEEILSFKDAASHADVLAIAPYVSFNVPVSSNEQVGDDKRFNDKAVSTWSLDQLFEHINKVSLPESVQWVKNNKKIADEYGLKLVAYEAGQHLAGFGGAENNERLTNLLLSANADARMGEIYTQSLLMWAENGGDLTCSYSSVGSWSKWGSWGLLQNHDDAPQISPKFVASVKWAISRGQKMAI